MLNWFRKPKVKKEPKEPMARTSLFSTHVEYDKPERRFDLAERILNLKKHQPIFTGEYAQDDSSDGFPQFKAYNTLTNTVSEAVVGWYASQGFIGSQLCGIIAQNWLVNKACAMPADDAIRKGYNIVSVDGDELEPEVVKIMKRYDRSMGLEKNMREFIRKGRIFGIRIAMFKVMSTDPDYYEKPFNIDGITAGSYKGIVQVDPYWTAPMLDGASASQPDTLHFYEPTWWIINGKKIHRSHLIIFRHAEPVDVLKPTYLYGGVPLTQQIMERVYASERTANEAPQLAMTKRTTVWLTDMEAVMSNSNAAIERLQQWAQYRDNFGVKLGDKDGDEFSQYDTSLADMDALIMTQYQLVAAIAGVPATKLIGTSPKGFGASGDYEEASYHELLESIQTHDLTPLAERHHALVMKSYVIPKVGAIDVETTLNWLPLDTPTAQELAATNLTKAQTSASLIQSGVLSSEDERQRIATDKQSGYNELGTLQEPEPEDDPEAGGNPFDKAEDSFNESDHPRSDNGQFGSGSGSTKSEEDPFSPESWEKFRPKDIPKPSQEKPIAKTETTNELPPHLQELVNKINGNPTVKSSSGYKSGVTTVSEVNVPGFSPTKDSVEWKEDKHPRADNGQFGSGGGGASKSSKSSNKHNDIEPYEKTNEKQLTITLTNKSGKEIVVTKSSYEKEKASYNEKGFEPTQSTMSPDQIKQALKPAKTFPNGGYIDHHGFEHSPNLSEAHRAIENNFYTDILLNTPKLVADYKTTYGNNIDPDLVKELDPNFKKDKSLAAAVHEPSSYLSKVIWAESLKAKKEAGDNSPVLFTAGGSGSGKSEAKHLAKALIDIKKDADPLTFDSVLGDYKKSVLKINEALDGQNGPIDIVYTNAPLELAIRLNLQRPRTVKIDTVINAHIAASENIHKLAEHYKNDKRVNIVVVNNTGDPPDLAKGELSDVFNYADREAVKTRIVDHAKKLVAGNKLQDKQGNPLKDQGKKLKMLLG